MPICDAGGTPVGGAGGQSPPPAGGNAEEAGSGPFRIKWHRTSDIAVVVLLAGGLLGTGIFGALWGRGARANAAIAALAAGRDVPVLQNDPGPVQAARGLFLLAHRHVEEAQALAERMPREDAAARAALLYALANAHMRQALMIFDSTPMRELAPRIQLAKSEYRAALRLDPGNWDARYNYDIANALVRDADPPPSAKGEEMAHERAYFPDIPGAPNGLP